jgi:hypothetical protein
VQRGETTRGVPTAYAAPPLSGQIVDNGELPPVWPDPDGGVRGATLEPLYKAAPKAVRKDPALHELLALVDALRDGRVRERQLAEKELSARLRKLLRGGSESRALRVCRAPACAGARRARVVGGCTTGLFITDPAAHGIRPTKDVDASWT